MNPVKIKITRLGMIQDSDEIILNKFMIFSGESGLGKSYLSIICQYVFAVLLNDRRISGYFDAIGFNLDEIAAELKSGPKVISISKKDFENWLSQDAITWMGYMVGNSGLDGVVRITLPDTVPDTIEFNVSEEVVEIGENLETYINLQLPGLSYKIKDSNGMAEESPFAFLFRYFLVKSIFNKHTDLTSSFIFPPSRGMMMTETVEPVIGMYTEFKRDLQQMLKAKPDRIEPTLKLKSLISNILDGHVEYKDGRYFYTTNNTEIPLSASAASVRELASLEFLVNNTDISKTAIMIDEPEAHLHPLKQRMMADILTCLVLEGSCIQVTTHSDYFLRRINELVLKYKLYQMTEEENNPEIYEKVCGELNENPEIRINPENISAYLLKRTEGNKSVIIRQNMENGVPFASFHSALDQSLRKKNVLEKLISPEDD